MSKDKEFSLFYKYAAFFYPYTQFSSLLFLALVIYYTRPQISPLSLCDAIPYYSQLAHTP